jgi:thiamine-phosphate pyrophosphorylase
MEGLLAHLERALYAATNVGFNRVIYNIEYSAIDYLTLANDDKQYSIVLDSSSSPRSFPVNRDAYVGSLFCFDYRSSPNASEAHFTHAINVIEGDVCVDILSFGQSGDVAEHWLFAGNTRSYRFSALNSFDFSSLSCQLGHLGWFIVALCLDFSIHDCLLIAQLGREVSRETWPDSYRSFLTLHSIQDGCACYPTRIGESGFEKLDSDKFNLYPVVDDESLIMTLAAMGVETIQLRVKDPKSNFEEALGKIIDNARSLGVQLFVNDYWQLALEHGAYGVHLGQEDLTEADLPRIKAAGMRLGISTHSYFEIIRAIMLCPSYIALGHIFPTQTKQMPSLPQGLHRLTLYQNFIMRSCQELRIAIPTCAIGGINLGNAASVMKTGVDAIAVVTAITKSQNLYLTLREFNVSLRRDCEVNR